MSRYPFSGPVTFVILYKYDIKLDINFHTKFYLKHKMSLKFDRFLT